MKAATAEQAAPYDILQISIHAAREGGDGSLTPCRLESKPFQSTPPVKAATATEKQKNMITAFQSTPPVKAATFYRVTAWRGLGISIHAAREGGDAVEIFAHILQNNFNPRRP